MPGRFLTDIQRDLFSSFPYDIDEEDVIKYFTLSLSDKSLIPTYSQSYNQFGFTLQLCTLRYLGFIPSNLNSVPQSVINYLGSQLKLDISKLKEYGKRSQTRNEHFNIIKDYLGFKRIDNKFTDNLINWLIDRALENSKPSLLLYLTIENLYQNKVIRPGISTLEELVSLARDKSNRLIFDQLSPILTNEVRDFLNTLLLIDTEINMTPFNWLKQKAISNTPEHLLEAVAKLEYLIKINTHSWNLNMINPNRLKSLFIAAKKSTPQSLQRTKELKRYPMLLAFAHQSYIEIIDELIDLFDGCLNKAHAGAKKDLDKFKKQNAKSTNRKVKLFKLMGLTILDDSIEDHQIRDMIYKQIPKDELEKAVLDCDKLIRPDDDNYFDFLDNRYSYIRQFAPAFLKTISFQANPANKSIIEGIDLINKLNLENKRNIPLDAPLDFVAPKWISYVIDKEGKIDRHFYELSLLNELQGTLKAGNVFVEKSSRYANPDSYLINIDKWQEIESDVCKEINLPLDGNVRLKERIENVNNRFDRVNKMLKLNGKVRIEKDELIITPLEALEKSESLEKLESLINERLPQIDLADLLIEVDSWTKYSRHFDHAGGIEKPPEQFLKKLYASIIAQGSNLGITRMAQIAMIHYKSLSWTSNWYIREETLKKAIDTLVNYHYHLPLSKFWGDGNFSSSDGQAVQISGKIRNAGYKSRIFGPNKLIEVYSWTSNQYSQYGSKVKPTGDRDATYVLDEILNNETDLEITEHTTDTAGYTYLVFALFDLLGMKFSPRIRDLKDQKLFKIENKSYKHLDSRIAGFINVDLILKHWADFKRVAGSLKSGHVTASLYISKLQAYPRKNNIARALQEYGKLIRTIYILEYLEDEEYRRHIQTQLNKGEAINGLRQFLSLPNERIIRKKQLEEQTNQASCLTLMANAVMTWNTVYMTAILEQLIEEGHTINEEDLIHISPARYEHINPYGKLLFDVEKELNRVGLRPLRNP